MLERTNLGGSASSWIGGLPRIPETSWPVSDKTDLPLHFISQIDLRAVRDASPEINLPNNGWLVFFADTSFEGTALTHGLRPRILHIADETTACPPPNDTPDLFGALFRSATEFHADHPTKILYQTPVNPRQKNWGDHQDFMRNFGAAYDDVFRVARDGQPFRIAAQQMRDRIEYEFKKRAFYGTRENKLRSAAYAEAQIELFTKLQHLHGDEFKNEVRKAGDYTGESNPRDAIVKARANIQKCEEEAAALPAGKDLLAPILAALESISKNGNPLEPMSLEE